MSTWIIPRALRTLFWDLHSLTWDSGAPPEMIATRTATIVAWVQQYADAGARVLDLGCATGTHTMALAAAGYAVTGVDISERMLARARVKAALDACVSAATGTVQFMRWDIEQTSLPEPGEYAVALCVGVLQCAIAPTMFLAVACRTLAPHGVLLIEVKDAATALPPSAGYSMASRAFAPLKRWASRSPAVHSFTRERLAAELDAAALRVIDDRSSDGWLRFAVSRHLQTSAN
jgi:SAM-dependent methyltransferase